MSNIPGRTQTLSAAISTLTQVPNGEVGAFRLTLIAVSIALTALIAWEILQRRTSRQYRPIE